MGVIVNKENTNNDELSRRIDADLRIKMAETSGATTEEAPDFVEESDYIKDFQKTGKFGWIWVVLIALALLSLFLIFFA